MTIRPRMPRLFSSTQTRRPGYREYDILGTYDTGRWFNLQTDKQVSVWQSFMRPCMIKWITIAPSHKELQIKFEGRLTWTDFNSGRRERKWRMAYLWLPDNCVVAANISMPLLKVLDRAIFDIVTQNFHTHGLSQVWFRKIFRSDLDDGNETVANGPRHHAVRTQRSLLCDVITERPHNNDGCNVTRTPFSHFSSSLFSNSPDFLVG
jgi:hypothetical protein